VIAVVDDFECVECSNRLTALLKYTTHRFLLDFFKGISTLSSMHSTQLSAHSFDQFIWIGMATFFFNFVILNYTCVTHGQHYCSMTIISQTTKNVYDSIVIPSEVISSSSLPCGCENL